MNDLINLTVLLLDDSYGISQNAFENFVNYFLASTVISPSKIKQAFSLVQTSNHRHFLQEDDVETFINILTLD